MHAASVLVLYSLTLATVSDALFSICPNRTIDLDLYGGEYNLWYNGGYIGNNRNCSLTFSAKYLLPKYYRVKCVEAKTFVIDCSTSMTVYERQPNGTPQAVHTCDTGKPELWCSTFDSGLVSIVLQKNESLPNTVKDKITLRVYVAKGPIATTTTGSSLNNTNGTTTDWRTDDDYITYSDRGIVITLGPYAQYTIMFLVAVCGMSFCAWQCRKSRADRRSSSNTLTDTNARYNVRQCPEVTFARANNEHDEHRSRRLSNTSVPSSTMSFYRDDNWSILDADSIHPGEVQSTNSMRVGSDESLVDGPYFGSDEDIDVTGTSTSDDPPPAYQDVVAQDYYDRPPPPYPGT